MLLRNPGSKFRVASRLLALRPINGCKEYREVCCASASVFFQIPEGQFESFWLNDKNEDVIRFYRALQADHDKSLRSAILNRRELLSSPEVVREQFALAQERFRARTYSVVDYLLLNRYALGQLVSRTRRNGASIDPTLAGGRGQGDGMSPITPARLDYCYHRLQGVRLTCDDLSKPLLDEVDGDHSCWVYADPPYLLGHSFVGTGPLYQCDFAYEDHLRLYDLLAASPHRWLLTYSACPFSVERYVTNETYVSPFRRRPGFAITQLPIRYTGVPRVAAHSGSKQLHSPALVTELVVMNYDD